MLWDVRRALHGAAERGFSQAHDLSLKRYERALDSVKHNRLSARLSERALDSVKHILNVFRCEYIICHVENATRGKMARYHSPVRWMLTLGFTEHQCGVCPLSQPHKTSSHLTTTGISNKRPHAWCFQDISYSGVASDAMMSVSVSTRASLSTVVLLLCGR